MFFLRIYTVLFTRFFNNRMKINTLASYSNLGLARKHRESKGTSREIPVRWCVATAAHADGGKHGTQVAPSFRSTLEI